MDGARSLSVAEDADPDVPPVTQGLEAAAQHVGQRGGVEPLDFHAHHVHFGAGRAQQLVEQLLQPLDHGALVVQQMAELRAQLLACLLQGLLVEPQRRQRIADVVGQATQSHQAFFVELLQVLGHGTQSGSALGQLLLHQPTPSSLALLQGDKLALGVGRLGCVLLECGPMLFGVAAGCCGSPVKARTRSQPAAPAPGAVSPGLRGPP